MKGIESFSLSRQGEDQQGALLLLLFCSVPPLSESPPPLSLQTLSPQGEDGEVRCILFVLGFHCMGPLSSIRP